MWQSIGACSERERRAGIQDNHKLLEVAGPHTAQSKSYFLRSTVEPLVRTRRIRKTVYQEVDGVVQLNADALHLYRQVQKDSNARNELV